VNKKRLPHTRGLKNYIEEKKTEQIVHCLCQCATEKRKKEKGKKKKEKTTMLCRSKNGQYSIIVM
jgi:hypothetical protein